LRFVDRGRGGGGNALELVGLERLREALGEVRKIDGDAEVADGPPSRAQKRRNDWSATRRRCRVGADSGFRPRPLRARADWKARRRSRSTSASSSTPAAPAKVRKTGQAGREGLIS
jgi:hypothetical protein